MNSEDLRTLVLLILTFVLLPILFADASESACALPARDETVRAASEAPDRPRLAILTDIGGDPDDQQSLVRLMVYANEFELEAFVATASGTRGELKEAVTRPDLILQVIGAYEQVLTSLKKHAAGWPEAETLRRCVKSGNPRREREYIGEGHDTEGSRFLIERIDAGTLQRPLNIAIWGGQTDLAQALWRVKHDRGSAAFVAFAKKLRVYDINDQDGIADWMRAEFPGMHYILANAPRGRDKREGTYRGMYLTGDESLTSREWIEANVRSRGPLGALYPLKTWTAPNKHGCLKEGDTPSWFFFLPLGGNDPSDPSRPGWGGQFRREADGWYRDLELTSAFDPRTTVSRWRPEFQADFARRMKWCLADEFKKTKRNPIAMLNGDKTKQILHVNAMFGNTLALSSADSGDPDGNAGASHWLIRREAGPLFGDVMFLETVGNETRWTIPPPVRASPKNPNLHVIHTVKDNDTPNLVAHRRTKTEIQP